MIFRDLRDFQFLSKHVPRTQAARARRDVGSPGVHFEPVEMNSDRWVRAKCKHCPWTHCANSTRMKNHYLLKHATVKEEEPEMPVADELEPALKEKKLLQTSIVAYSDLAFTASQQARAEALLVMVQVEQSVAYNALEGDAMQKF